MELRPYQKRIANWLCQHPHACLSVGMGLGKTAAVLHFLEGDLKENNDKPAADYTQYDEMELPY